MSVKRQKPIASLSLDLDNKWSYMKTHGDPGWETFPSYLDLVVPRFLDMLRERKLDITVFVVGQDAAIESNQAALRSIAEAGHEIGNHSFRHEPWLHLYELEDLRSELTSAHEAIAKATGSSPVGFRGPGFSLSKRTLEVLSEMGYSYDASTFPTYLGPLARAYYFLRSKGLTRQQKEERKRLFGTWKAGLQPLKPYRWVLDSETSLAEIPVTTTPIVKLPMHFSYLLYLGKIGSWAPLLYFKTALALCRLTGAPPSLLLHPLDFLGAEDDEDLAFFPAMDLGAERKLALLRRTIDMMNRQYRVVTLREQAAELSLSSIAARAPAQVAGLPH